MKTKQLLFACTLIFFTLLAGNAAAQEASNHRQRKLDRRETVNTNKQTRIEERNPKGIGRKDNRVERRGDRIDRKKERTDKRVKRRRSKVE